MLRGLAAAVPVLAVLLAVGVVGLRVADVQPVTVLTGSMRPAVAPGDVVLVQRGEASELRAGEIATFRDPRDRDRTLTHRVRAFVPASRPIDGLPAVTVTTRGDANQAAERWTVPLRGSVGEVRAVVPGFAGLRPLLVGRGRAAATAVLTVGGVLLLLAAAAAVLRAPARRT